MYDSKLVNSLFRFEIDSSKYHHKTVVLLLTAHILSLQDVALGVCFFLYFVKLSAGKGFWTSIEEYMKYSVSRKATTSSF